MATLAAEVGSMRAEVCPSCGLRDIDDPTGSGFCIPCSAQRRAESYLASEADAIAIRRADWADRTIARELDRPANTERQARKRMLDRVRPREPAPPHTDPLRLAEAALMHLGHLRSTARRSAALLSHLEAAEELIRQLAWGPVSSPGRVG